MKAVYFAWVRERIGVTEEEIAPPADVRTVGDLIGWLTAGASIMPMPSRAPGRSGRPSTASTLKHDAPIAGAREIAFPPMTGG